jgi:hypothetical protein
MSAAALDMILNSPTCRGAFRLDGDRMEPLKVSGPNAGEAAERMRDLWVSLNAVVPDADLVIGKHADGYSVASQRGGMLLETNSLPNLGILRSALKNEDTITPAATDAKGPANAVLDLASWIDGTETRRAMEVVAGEARIRLWARKGRFGLLDGQTPATVAEHVSTASDAGQKVLLTLVEWTSDAPDMTFQPLELLAPSASDNWVFGANGTPEAAPRSATLDQASKAATLAQRLATWGQGNPFQIEVLRDNASRDVIARSEDATRIELNF